MSDAIFRYTVKCDRAANATIERKAKAAGVSAGVFVQEAFDAFLAGGADLTILPAAAIARKPPAPRPVAKPHAHVHQYKPTREEMAARCDRLHRHLDSLPRRADGMTECHVFGEAGVGRAVGLSDTQVDTALRRLIADGRVFRIIEGGGGRGRISKLKVTPADASP